MTKARPERKGKAMTLTPDFDASEILVVLATSVKHRGMLVSELLRHEVDRRQTRRAELQRIAAEKEDRKQATVAAQ